MIYFEPKKGCKRLEVYFSNEPSSSVYKPGLALKLGGGQHISIYPFVTILTSVSES